MANALTQADLFALTRNPDATFLLEGRPVTTTALNRFASRRGGSALTLPLMPIAWRMLRTPPYDLVITSSHAFARAFPAAKAATHLSYTHASMRYVWLTDIDRRMSRLRIPQIALRPFKALDRRYAQTVDSFAANSLVTKERIEAFYGREARVIHPPCDTEYFSIDDTVPRTFVLSASRLVPYKRHDLAIDAAARLGERIVIAGSGPDEARLRRLANAVHPGGVEFVISPTREELRTLYRSAAVLVFGAFEDFGIVPVEAQACGTPVIAFDGGGSRETVLDGVSGRLVPTQSAADFADGLADILSRRPTAAACRASALRFSNARFRNEFTDWVASSS